MARLTNLPRVTVFISSPSDLAEERRLARELIERLSGGEFGGRRLRLVPLLWEDEAPAITGDPAQLAVDYYMVDSRATYLNQWREHKANIYDDYRRRFGKTPGGVVGILVQTNSNHTASIGEGMFGEIIASRK